jgi:glycosyltransferase involved in cell wall biosynthesis
MSSPRVSIALPVYNGERFLRRALDSCLAQDFEDFELIIVDNASDDGTQEISLEYSHRDPRVRYVRNQENIGAQANHNLAFELASGEYFKWTAHDDWITPDFLSRCIAELDRDPTAVMCFTYVAHTDDAGDVFRIRRDDAGGAGSANVRERLHTVVWSVREIAAPVFGLMRSEALRATGLLRPVPEPDRLLIGELALLGPLIQIPEVLLYRYLGQAHKTRNSWVWVHPANVGRLRLATPKLVLHHLRAIGAAEEPLTTKVALSADLLTGFAVTRARYKYQLIKWRRSGQDADHGFLDTSGD